MVIISKMIDEIFLRPDITDKSQVVALLKESNPNISDEDVEKCIQVAINMYQKKLDVLLSYPGKFSS